MNAAHDPGLARRVELVLQRLESLPTLSPIAVRALHISGSASSGAREIVPLIESDPALTARLLRMCRMAHTGLGSKITTVERAVVMLGLDAVRTMLLSVEVMGLYGEEGEATGGPEAFNPRDLWLRAIAVACASDGLAASVGVDPSEAFVAGLLHNLGTLGMYRVVPGSFPRMVEIAKRSVCDLSLVAMRTVGIDQRTLGKRLAEQWGLPHVIQDVMMFAGHSALSLPDVPHRKMISVISVACAIARRQHLGFDGDFSDSAPIPMVCKALGIGHDRAVEVMETLHDRVAERAAVLGLDDKGEEGLLMRALADANARLGELHQAVARRATNAELSRRVLDGVRKFYEDAGPRRHWAGGVESVAESASALCGGGACVVCWPEREGQWEAAWYDGERLSTQLSLNAPTDHSTMNDSGLWRSIGQVDAGLMASICRGLESGGSGTIIRVLPLRAPWGLVGVLGVTKDPAAAGLSDAMLEPIVSVWGAWLASIRQHEGAKRFGEQLAQAMRDSARMQSTLIESESMARLGRLAAGAAHEMNNPLAAISGRAQILARRLEGTEGAEAARAIIDASEKLSDLIQGLHVFASPPEVMPERVDASTLVSRAVKQARRRVERAGQTEGAQDVRLRVDRAVPPLFVDPDQLSDAISELVSNALQSSPKERVEVRVHVEPSDDRLIVTVRDDGVGMSPETLAGAFDPFFSSRSAGRLTGLGLAKARRLVEAHGGELTLESVEGKGTTGRIVLPAWRWKSDDKAEPGDTTRHAA